MTNNPVVFWELAAHDADASAAFCNKVFGWNLAIDERLGFYVMPGDPERKGIGGGVFTLKRAKLPFVTVYILVDSLDAKLALIEEEGGFIVDPPQDIGENRICLFNEPSGVTFAMIERPSPEA